MISLKEKSEKLPTLGYKGTRDFYPDDMRLRNYLFAVMRKVVESYGYEEYDGPMIESLDLYRAKTGEEIVGKQIYDFIDKGGREVAIRPEMTPTLARMVAAKARELPRPIRWFSFPNLWRYEQPGHGRLREHWQLNVDMFGVDGFEAELEILKLACDILFAFGADKRMFRVRLSHRKLMDGFFTTGLNLDPAKGQELSKTLDKKNKITADEYKSDVKRILPDDPQALEKIERFLTASINDLEFIPGIDLSLRDEITNLFKYLDQLGLGEVVEFDPSVVRGFDYYTGFVFEIFDTSPANKRSLYGGGRYDNLTGLFSNEALSGTGFGLGDVTLKNFLETHNLLPKLGREDVICIPLLDESLLGDICAIADELRKNGIQCETLLNPSQKFGKQITLAEKKGFKYILICGADEIAKSSYALKNLQDRTQVDLPRDQMIELLKKELFT